MFCVLSFMFLPVSTVLSQHEEKALKKNDIRLHLISPLKRAFAAEYEYRIGNRLGCFAEGGYIHMNNSNSRRDGGYGSLGIKVYAQAEERAQKNSVRATTFLTARTYYERFDEKKTDTSISPEDVTSFQKTIGTAILGGGFKFTLRETFTVETGFGMGYLWLNKTHTSQYFAETEKAGQYFHHAGLFNESSRIVGKLWLSAGICF